MNNSNSTQLLNILVDGLILLAASTVLGLTITFGLDLFKDDKVDGNPLVTTIAKAAANDREKKKTDTKEQNKPLDPAAQQKAIASTRRAEQEMAQKLKENTKYLNRRDNHNATALMMICYVNYFNHSTTLETDEDRLPYIKQLVEKGASIHDIDKDGWSPLCWAAWSGLPRICAYFHKLGADISIRDHQGNTPLIMAAIRGNTEVIQYLLQHGADKNARCNNGMTALDYARREYERISSHSLIADLNYIGLDIIDLEDRKNNIERFKKAVEILENA